MVRRKGNSVSRFLNRRGDTRSERLLKFGVRQLALAVIVVIAVVIYLLLTHH
jgi:hypothetical protein